MLLQVTEEAFDAAGDILLAKDSWADEEDAARLIIRRYLSRVPVSRVEIQPLMAYISRRQQVNRFGK